MGLSFRESETSHDFPKSLATIPTADLGTPWICSNTNIKYYFLEQKEFIYTFSSLKISGWRSSSGRVVA